MVKEEMKLAIKCNGDGEEIINFLISLGYKNYNNLTGECISSKQVYYSGGYDNVIHCIIYTVGIEYVFESLEEAKRYYDMEKRDQIAIKVTTDNGKEIVKFLESLGYDRNNMKGDASPGFYYYTDAAGKVWAGVAPSIVENTFDSLEEAKKYYNMDEKELKIEIPKGYEIDKENSTFECIKFKKKELTYSDTAEKLFNGGLTFFINSDGSIKSALCMGDHCADPNNCTSLKQAEKLLAINKLMNVAKYLNRGWTPNWKDNDEFKYYIRISIDKISIVSNFYLTDNIIYFKTFELAEEAIKILGEETIRLALPTDY